MTSRILSIEGPLARTPFPEREDKSTSSPDLWARALVDRLSGVWATPAAREVRSLAGTMARGQAALSALPDAELRRQLQASAGRAVHELRRADLHQALLQVAEIAWRTLAMRPYPSQLVGAATLLRGELAEMQTGEGKTLTAGLAACLAGAAGVPVHVVTVNDYLAQRDADKLAPLFAFMGLQVGVVVHGIDPPEKRRAYNCPITYCTNKDLVFDYLRDRVAAGGRANEAQMRGRSLFGGAAEPLMLRGLHLAIVDEADSVLIDEARTPLILAEKAGAIAHAEQFPRALQIAAGLSPGQHFTIDAGRRELHLSAAGRAHLGELCGSEGGPWRAAHAREHLITQALRATRLFLRDQQYLVDDEGKVQIIDEYTGRVLPGRNWEQGLHQMIEAKEGVELSEQTQTLARITYQRFFTRYLRLGGMTGTAREMAVELASVYRLRTVTIPTHRPSARRRLPDIVCVDEDHKWRAVAERVEQWHGEGRPVLIGTRSVDASERLSRVLAGYRLPHQVLNARQDAHEAEMVANAGQRGVITVATNMAGRGTDIELGPGIAQGGGLCVILTEYHESPRIDRQLFGRCARQGDPGTCVAIVAIDDSLFKQHGGTELAMLNQARSIPGATLEAWVARCRRNAQARAERMHARTRRDTLRRDRDLDKLMAFSGDPL
ncbi:MAG: DEAD/DEAH box helicase [Caldimonas sp.]